MTFIRIKDVPPPAPTELVCGQSRLMRLIGFVIALGFFITPILLPATGAIRWVLLALAAMMFLFAWLFGRMLQRSFGTQNWLIRATPSRMLIKFRSFANAHFSVDDSVVLELHPREIESIGLLKESWLRPRGDYHAPVQDRSTSIEFTVKGIDLEELSRRLAAERANMGPGTHSKTRYGDFPVRLVDSTVRVQLRGGSSFTSPSPKRLIQELSRVLKVEMREARRRKLDLANPANEQSAMENQILELAERGDRIGAMTLARMRYGCSLVEAKKFVEDLCNTARAA